LEAGTGARCQNGTLRPDTLLHWHRDLFRWIWKRRSRPKHKGRRAPLPDEVAALIRQVALENRSWGAERIRGELLKLGLRVAKSTIQAYVRGVREARSPVLATCLIRQDSTGEIRLVG
jgi:hypothetical protein